MCTRFLYHHTMDASWGQPETTKDHFGGNCGRQWYPTQIARMAANVTLWYSNIGGWGALNRAIVSFRACVSARGLFASRNELDLNVCWLPFSLFLLVSGSFPFSLLVLGAFPLPSNTWYITYIILYIYIYIYIYISSDFCLVETNNHISSSCLSHNRS